MGYLGWMVLAICWAFLLFFFGMFVNWCKAQFKYARIHVLPTDGLMFIIVVASVLGAITLLCFSVATIQIYQIS